ncbi:hypothetical protein ACEPAH_2162 [Sanghuangporus vaninii]
MSQQQQQQQQQQTLRDPEVWFAQVKEVVKDLEEPFWVIEEGLFNTLTEAQAVTTARQMLIVQLEVLKERYCEYEHRPVVGSEDYASLWRQSVRGFKEQIKNHRDDVRSWEEKYGNKELELQIYTCDLFMLFWILLVQRRPPNMPYCDVWSEDAWLAWKEVLGIFASSPITDDFRESLQDWGCFEEGCPPRTIEAASALVALQSHVEPSGTV